MTVDSAPKCPFASTRKDSKSAAIVAARMRVEPGAERVLTYEKALLRVPGVRLERAPEIGWSDLLMSYELRNALVTCDRGA